MVVKAIITKIISEIKVDKSWTKEFQDKEFIMVNLECDLHYKYQKFGRKMHEGCVSEKCIGYFEKDEWEQIKNKDGLYLSRRVSYEYNSKISIR